MTDDRTLERAAREWLEEGPTRAPQRPVSAALSRLHTTPQERELLLPWRFPTMKPMALIAAVAVVAMVAIGSILYAMGDPRGSDSEPTRSPVPTPMTMDSYRTTRNEICDAAIAAVEPYRADFGDFDGSISPVERTAWVAALRAYAGAQSHATDEWAALVPPEDFRATHETLVAQYRDLEARILSIASNLEAESDVAASQVDASTNIVSQQILAAEDANELRSCP